MSDDQPFVKACREEDWSRGILIGLSPDPNSGYRATVWFEYTRWLFNEIREGSLIAVRNFSDRPRQPDGVPVRRRQADYEEYSILQVDQIHPWHYAIQGSGDQGFPGFTTAAAESARRDWTEMDEANRDDVSRIRCEAIPLRLAFQPKNEGDNLPKCFHDRSMPMPGYEARLLTRDMTEQILNRDLDPDTTVELGRHVVQHDVDVGVQIPDLLRLHFGIFGYTGAGKSNLVSTLCRKALSREPNRDGNKVYKIVLFDLMDEYTGLLIDQLVLHNYSRLVVAGRKALDKKVLDACEAMVTGSPGAEALVSEAASIWSRRLTLPSELAKPEWREAFAAPLRQLILNNKVVFYEPPTQQGQDFTLNIKNQLIDQLGPRAFANSTQDTQQWKSDLWRKLQPLEESALKADPTKRDGFLYQISEILESLSQDDKLSQQARRKIEKYRSDSVTNYLGARGSLGSVGAAPDDILRLLNFQPKRQGHMYYPSLTVIIGEDDLQIARFGRRLIEQAFEDRREKSILDPPISFVFDEADVFISSGDAERRRVAAEVRGRRGEADKTPRMVYEATVLARRGRKFGLGLGFATQRIRYLDTSILAQPHTYFISRLPRKSDRVAVAEAFAISDETLEQTFAFTTGQWLVASHDATGLKGTPFPVQMENANTRIRDWLGAFSGTPMRDPNALETAP